MDSKPNHILSRRVDQYSSVQGAPDSTVFQAMSSITPIMANYATGDSTWWTADTASFSPIFGSGNRSGVLLCGTASLMRVADAETNLVKNFARIAPLCEQHNTTLLANKDSATENQMHIASNRCQILSNNDIAVNSACQQSSNCSLHSLSLKIQIPNFDTSLKEPTYLNWSVPLCSLSTWNSN